MHSEQFHRRVVHLDRKLKRFVMIITDVLMVIFALWTAYYLRLSDPWNETYLRVALPLFVLAPICSVAIFKGLGLYRAVIRYLSSKALNSIGMGAVLAGAALYIAAYVLGIQPFPRGVPIIFAMLCLIYVGGSRVLVRSYYEWLIKRFANEDVVLVYGAGSAGAQLVKALSGGGEYQPIGFIDDDSRLVGSTVASLPVYDTSSLDELIGRYEIDFIFLALPNVSPSRRAEIIENLSQYSVHVKTMPSFAELVSGENAQSLREVGIEDLLGREVVPPNKELLDQSIDGRNVLVTGAGGSIGSELARQALLGGARSLLLYDQNEFALYQVHQELLKTANQKASPTQIVPLLGSVLDRARLLEVMTKFNVQTVYHAAAYKHVPLVEHNVVEGLRNNSYGTMIAAQVAAAAKVERFVLVSTDKAVRPTNVMGATKRFAELIVQNMADKAGSQNSGTVFSMVRFGNVLGSSGSVVPAFKEQIAQGGPVTVTHPEITRFFMTIPEAASLVIQAGSLANGGDVFVLDMGEPVKIIDLAKKMITLSGASIRSAEYPDGEIEIVFTGLRPGEKLYEELLIGANVFGTEHPKIMRATEAKLLDDELELLASKLAQIVESGDSEAARTLLQTAVTEYQAADTNVDFLG